MMTTRVEIAAKDVDAVSWSQSLSREKELDGLLVAAVGHETRSRFRDGSAPLMSVDHCKGTTFYTQYQQRERSAKYLTCSIIDCRSSDCSLLRPNRIPGVLEFSRVLLAVIAYGDSCSRY